MLEDCCLYPSNKKEKTEWSYWLYKELARLYISIHTKTMGLSILNPDHTAEMYLCLLTELFIIQQICTKCLLCARCCGRCWAYDGKQHRHSLHPRGVQCMWVSMCKRHHEVRWGSLWTTHCNLTFQSQPDQPYSQVLPHSEDTSLWVYLPYAQHAMERWCREQRQSSGFNWDTGCERGEKVAFPHPFQAPYSMLPWR